MIPYKVPDHEVDKKLYHLYFEINLLQGRLESASPLVRMNCEDDLRSLFGRYEILEARVEAIHQAKQESQIEQRDVNDRLQELRSALDSIGRWILIQTEV